MVHGWGLAPGLWRPMLGHMGPVELLRADLGFFHPHGQVTVPLPEGDWLGVGHSMGGLWLLQALLGEAETPQMAALARCKERCRGLVFINGFSRFHQGADFPHGVGARVIGRMRKQLTVDAMQVLRDFGSRSGLPVMGLPPGVKPHVARLDEGLAAISRWDGRAILQGWSHPFLAIASREDAIVSAAMSEQMFGGSALQWIEGGSHLLPLTHGQQMAAALQQSLESWL